MPDGITFSMITEPFHNHIQERQVKMRRAAMWTVREGGRFMSRSARRGAPVLKDATAVRFAAWKKSGRAWSNAPVAGLLRGSISSSRVLRESNDSWSLRVAPRGARVRLYASKIEAKHPYMQPAYRETVAAMQAISEKAYLKVWSG